MDARGRTVRGSETAFMFGILLLGLGLSAAGLALLFSGRMHWLLGVGWMIGAAFAPPLVGILVERGQLRGLSK